jgi:uncharacterized protein (TIGR02145 family)
MYMQMKKLFFLLGAFLIGGMAFAQVPQKLSYEAIVRDSAFVELDNVQISIQLSLVSDTTSDTPVYTETHTPTTGSDGLVQLLIGTGTTTDTFSGINWAEGPYFLMTKIDPAGGTDYTISGETRMLAVPYAQVSVSATKADTVGRASGLNFRVSYQGDSLVLGNGKFLILPGLSVANPSFPSGFVHCDPDNPTEINLVTSTTGAVWMDRNLGASRVAESSTDSLAYGSWFQWGRFADGHQCRNSAETSTLASTTTASADQAWAGKFIVINTLPFDWLSTQDNNLWQGVDGVNNPCPTGFRIPTETEWEGERAKWAESGNKNSTGAYNSPLKLPVSGYRSNSSGGPFGVGSRGRYWSSSVSGSDARYLYFYSSDAGLRSNYRAFGGAVRCLKD